MHEFIQRWMKEGNSIAPRRIAKAGMKGFNNKKAIKWLLYLDANNFSVSLTLRTCQIFKTFHQLLNEEVEVKTKESSTMSYIRNGIRTPAGIIGCCNRWAIAKSIVQETRNLACYKLPVALPVGNNDEDKNGSRLPTPTLTLWPIHYDDSTQKMDLWKLMNKTVFGKTMEDVKELIIVRPIGEEYRLRKMLSDQLGWT
ncbi:hypothetical protein RhiirA4_465915 [Rhizophagus irregularis]|uniref:Uncharacterized protein n=1 Tax=Rhizophagus irregularis TaxID=588596 RepID=A0A2I1GT19_9GLOM|nr:hypothetical protein RhiirA4_465915 [Rhizophagus irregularis]